MAKMIAICDWLTEYTGKFISWATLAMLLFVIIVVVMRYFFSIGITWLQDLALYLHGAVITLGVGYTLKHNGHVRVDVFYRHFSHKTQHCIDLIGNFIFLLPLLLVIAWWCWGYVTFSWQVAESSVEAGGLGFVYIQKSLLIVFVVSLAIQWLADVGHHWQILFSKGK